MARAIAALPTAWRCAIISVMWGDAECCIELTLCTPEAAVGIAQALAQVLEGRDIVVNGLWFDGELDWFKRAYRTPWTTRPGAR